MEKDEEKPQKNRLETDDAAPTPRKCQAWLNNLKALSVIKAEGVTLTLRGLPHSKSSCCCHRVLGKVWMAASRNTWDCHAR